MKKLMQIHQFDPVIYPVKLWVVCTNKYIPLDERFCDAYNSQDLDFKFIDEHEAVACYVKERIKDGCFGILVIFTKKEFFNIKNIAHETSHAVDYIFEHICEKKIGDESRTYLVGWAVDCMNQVRTNKFK